MLEADHEVVRITHEKLMKRVRERVADGRVLKLIEAFLKAKIMEGK